MLNLSIIGKMRLMVSGDTGFVEWANSSVVKEQGMSLTQDIRPKLQEVFECSYRTPKV